MKKINICVSSSLHILLLFFLVGCNQSNNDESVVGPKEPLPLVTTTTTQPQQLDVYEELPGRVKAVRVAEIRPQVAGIVQHRLFKQGAEVKAGQSLFQIEPAPFAAEVDTAKANLQRAQVTYQRALDKEQRLKPLVEADAISRQEYDDVVLQRDQAAAEVAVAKATLTRRELDLKFANVKAPISGLIEQTLVTEGALVSSTDATPMTRIQQIDQVFVDIRRPASSLEAMREALAANSDGEPSIAGTKIEILRSNGTPYQVKGEILFSGINIDEGTGDVLLRVLVDNSQRLLLPGMFVKAKVLYSSYDNALMVPQQAVTHLAGAPHLWSIDQEGYAHLKPVKLGELIDGQYHVKSGISKGENIVIEGKERLEDGILVDQRKWEESEVLLTSVAN
ncbi:MULTISPECIES: efflux RND transporter periplasmic adaptor subunit [Vibrio]|uniref:efflux RND transporter periplasmic adaptor subunit n=1 Tax=Vibrio TaxID=662 RepID=UPI0004E413F1|nr:MULTISPECIES: efflux RND transporter periplasmic adaptor subunit [Vibrio]KFD82502.1 efflux transporter, RND family, MFP subunit [Vibrio paracholerae]MCO7011229.1 efflux RND transporter periplasmic adaptor subunit [Vibrio paracholerae]MCO7025117.1 efflux RND transporter periplasmic adaptor subunit [Vibrio paracholerae]MCO7031847.1 efflux RND transporter periplasmic adaptor subunit [Vibrio paracholerae]MCO7044953.1 efflux RND transporter periplasmic adaptor subunit [Vibrio paracholerae]